MFAIGGGLGLDVALRRALRAALLVVAATWLRAAAGFDGLREVSRRVLGRLRRFPSAPEAAGVLDQIDVRAPARGRGALADASWSARRRTGPRPILDAVLAWVMRESAAFRAAAPDAPLDAPQRAPPTGR